jgi:hypothetical protein
VLVLKRRFLIGTSWLIVEKYCKSKNMHTFMMMKTYFGHTG